jgi:hypothetical protein
MEVLKLKSWSDFREQVAGIRKKYSKSIVLGSENPILFRGQAVSDWKLETTLERASKMEWTISAYFRLARKCLPQIESFTEKKWDVPIIEQVESLTERPKHLEYLLPGYEFWVYLRHHGFPSPLLDWSMSPYVAAFFAFENPCPSDSIAIFTYIPAPTGMRAITSSHPNISPLRPLIKTHKRHFLQQSCYTICTKNEKFVCHENVFEDGNPNIIHEQDTLFKLEIPMTERVNALRDLYDLNINAFSLMQSEESLSKTMCFQEIEVLEDNLNKQLNSGNKTANKPLINPYIKQF